MPSTPLTRIDSGRAHSFLSAQTPVVPLNNHTLQVRQPSRSQEVDVVFHVRPVVFTGYWALVLALQVSLVVYYAMYCYVYLKLRVPTSELHDVVQTLHLQFGDGVRIAVMVMMAFFAGAHGFQVVLALAQTILHRRLVFESSHRRSLTRSRHRRRRPQRPPDRSDDSSDERAKGNSDPERFHNATGATSEVTRRNARSRRVTPPPVNAGKTPNSLTDQALVTLRKQTSPNDRRFLVMTLIRTLVQVTWQIQLAYLVSASMSREWVIQVVVGALVLNCWCTPLTQWALSSNLRVQRSVLLWKLVVFDFAISMGYTLMTMGPYWTLHHEIAANREMFLDQPAQVIETASELSAIWIRLWSSTFLVFVHSVTFYDNLRNLKTIVKVQSDQVRPMQSLLDVWQKPKADHGKRAGCLLEMLKEPSGLNIIHGMLMLLGSILLGAHIMSMVNSRQIESLCLFESQPWFSAGFACLMVHLDCVQHQIVGSEHQVTNLLRSMDPDYVISLSLANCQQLEMIPMLQEMHSIVWLSIVNATLVRWDETAALTSEMHPIVHNVKLVNVTIAEYPRGLLAPEYPTTLDSLKLSNTNLTSLPATLAQLVPQYHHVFCVERSQLREVPGWIANRSFGSLSFAGNNIATIPEELFLGESFTTVSFADNPITELPSCWLTSTFSFFSVENTLIARLPGDWEHQSARLDHQHQLFARGTPLCQSYVDAPLVNAPLAPICGAWDRGLSSYLT